MTRAEYLALSTKLAEDMKVWIEKSHAHHGLSEGQLLILNQAADIIDRTTVVLAEARPDGA